MTVGEVCNRYVAFAEENDTLREAARRMRRLHVGDLVVIEETPAGRRPIGILTDRDVVVGPIAEGRDIDFLRLGDVMTQDLVTAKVTEDVDRALERMRLNGIRRLPVVGADGMLQGILTLDDVLDRLDEELSDLVRLVAREQVREVERRPAATA